MKKINIGEMYKSSSFGRRREKKESKKEIFLAIWSTAWRTIAFTLFVLGGYKLAILWYHNFPESLPLKWVVGLIGGEIGAVVCLLFIILPMGKRRKRR